MTNATGCAVLCTLAFAAAAATRPPQAAGGAQVPAATARDVAPTTGTAPRARPANPAADARDAARRAALAERVATLLPAPLDDGSVRALATALGLQAGQREQVEILRGRYRDAVDARRAAAADALSARIGSAYGQEPGTDSLAPRQGPELAAVLTAALEWRTALAAADTQLVLGLAGQRDEAGSVGPGLARFTRTVERDDLAAADPVAAIRLPDLVEAAALPDADRRAIVDALEPHWARLADAIGARRLAAIAAEAKAAGEEAAWGAEWELTASPATIAERASRRAELETSAAAAERALAEANRAAIAALLRMLPSASADRVRSTVDVAMWPVLWAPERAMASTIAAVRASAPAPVLEMADAAAADVMRRLEPTRMELSRRAQAADAADEALALAGAGDARPAALVNALAARKAVEELAERRRRTVADGVARMVQLLGDHPKEAAALAALKSELDSAGRAADWRVRGLTARLDEAAGSGEPAPPAPDRAP
ncbi:MAG: hypothetical protein ACOYO7_00665 [Phycisphaerales bacterium]|jgi:hypothetical protein